MPDNALVVDEVEVVDVVITDVVLVVVVVVEVVDVVVVLVVEVGGPDMTWKLHDVPSMGSSPTIPNALPMGAALGSVTPAL